MLNKWTKYFLAGRRASYHVNTSIDHLIYSAGAVTKQKQSDETQHEHKGTGRAPLQQVSKTSVLRAARRQKQPPHLRTG